MSLHATASQTVGPFFHIGLERGMRDDLAPAGASGPRILIQGRVLDGAAAPVNDALIEIWQADEQGVYAHPDDTRGLPAQAGFMGFGRVCTDDTGHFRFSTVKPGRVPGPNASLQAPHLLVAVFMRGLLRHLFTRIYFPGEASNEQDALLACVAPARRHTLVARPLAGQPGVLEWNVLMQGADETVFFDY